jgi:tetratricopeptide (TPR) repeat protein
MVRRILPVLLVLLVAAPSTFAQPKKDKTAKGDKAKKGDKAATPAATGSGDGELEFEPDEIERSGPPSKTLARATKLYDKGEYYSASIEFDKVIKGETDDSAANKQKAEFFMAKTLYHMRFYSASLSYFDSIVQQGAAHKYYRRTLQWLAALAKVLPESAGILKKIGVYSKEDLEDPALEPVRSELYFLLGRYYYQEGTLDQAIEMFKLVPQSSEYYVQAKFFEAVCWVLVPKGASAVEALKEILIIAREPGTWKPDKMKGSAKMAVVRQYEELANLTMGRVFYSTKQYPLSIKYFEKLPQASSDWLQSLFEASWAYYMMKGNGKALGNILTLNAPYFEDQSFPESVVLQAVIYYNYCQYDKALEAVTDFIEKYPPLRDQIRKITEKDPDDNGAFYAFVKKIRSGEAGLPEDVQLLAVAALQDKTLLKTFAYVDELDREIAQHDRSDKAWKTTRIAIEVYQDLTLQKSIAEDAAGRLARDRLVRLDKELTSLNSDARSVKISIMEARIGTKKAAALKEEFTIDTKPERMIVDDEHETWEFNGEYWKDELGFYRYRLTPMCPKRK